MVLKRRLRASTLLPAVSVECIHLELSSFVSSHFYELLHVHVNLVLADFTDTYAWCDMQTSVTLRGQSIWCDFPQFCARFGCLNLMDLLAFQIVFIFNFSSGYWSCPLEANIFWQGCTCLSHLPLPRRLSEYCICYLVHRFHTPGLICSVNPQKIVLAYDWVPYIVIVCVNHIVRTTSLIWPSMGVWCLCFMVANFSRICSVK